MLFENCWIHYSNLGICISCMEIIKSSLVSYHAPTQYSLCTSQSIFCWRFAADLGRPISKACHAVNPYKLYFRFLKSSCPVWVLEIINYLLPCVETAAYRFICSKEWQGCSLLTSSSMSVSINPLLIGRAGLSCINKSCIGCAMYAGDIILQPESVVRLQALCLDIGSQLCLRLNCAKSWCLTFGPWHKSFLSHMFLCQKRCCGPLRWNIWKLFLAGKKLICDKMCIA